MLRRGGRDPSDRRHRRGPDRARGRRASRGARRAADRVRGRPVGRRAPDGVESRAGVLAVALQRRRGRREAAACPRMGGARPRCAADRGGSHRALPASAGGASRDRAAPPPERAGHRDHPRRVRQDEDGRQGGGPVRAAGPGRRWLAVPGPRARGHRRLGNLEHAQSARRRWVAGGSGRWPRATASRTASRRRWAPIDHATRGGASWSSAAAIRPSTCSSTSSRWPRPRRRPGSRGRFAVRRRARCTAAAPPMRCRPGASWGHDSSRRSPVAVYGS